MSWELFEVIRGMNLKDMEIQLALQCAPLIMRLKVSNLFSISHENVNKVIAMLKNTDISYYILLKTSKKTTLLLYREKELQEYLRNSNTRHALEDLGYSNIELEKILPIFRRRYQEYMLGSKNFPHEMGLLLGYPVEDVVGFIKHEGKNYLHTGYWKVYENVDEKVELFLQFEQAKERLVHLISNGGSILENIAV